MKLKPCPFCGSYNVKYILDSDSVECLCCNTAGPDHKNKEFAIKLWNTRKRPKKKETNK